MAMQRARAFTLIELLVVILIIAVMSAVIIPAFAGYYEKSRFDAEVRRIQDYFALAREKAVKGGTVSTIHFEHSIHEMTLQVESLPPQNDLPTAMLTTAGTDLSPAQQVGPLHIGDDYIVDNFRVFGAEAQAGLTQTDIRFHGDGTSDGAELDIKSRQGYTAHLSLAPMTGRLALDVPAGSAR